ncbi:hypothetical protein HPB50_012571 [Hyalomma asiaticum]|uniref:Uncharacterized protein n=1 Tax=Hyalomma asiaticum TaxID=266040 RepID=A0ACB7S0E7_HYAAI|nr:hypothetical protein HPB50_012571 [Hyalomma asiaticum]
MTVPHPQFQIHVGTVAERSPLTALRCGTSSIEKVASRLASAGNLSSALRPTRGDIAANPTRTALRRQTRSWFTASKHQQQGTQSKRTGVICLDAAFTRSLVRAAALRFSGSEENAETYCRISSAFRFRVSQLVKEYVRTQVHPEVETPGTAMITYRSMRLISTTA